MALLLQVGSALDKMVINIVTPGWCCTSAIGIAAAIMETGMTGVRSTVARSSRPLLGRAQSAWLLLE